MVCQENTDLRAKEVFLRNENKKLLSVINFLGDQKKQLLSDKQEIERLERELIQTTEERLATEQRLDEALHEVSELQAKVITGESLFSSTRSHFLAIKSNSLL